MPVYCAYKGNVQTSHLVRACVRVYELSKAEFQWGDVCYNIVDSLLCKPYIDFHFPKILQLVLFLPKCSSVCIEVIHPTQFVKANTSLISIFIQNVRQSFFSLSLSISSINKTKTTTIIQVYNGTASFAVQCAYGKYTAEP